MYITSVRVPDAMQLELKQHVLESEALKRELETAKAKCNFLENAIAQWQKEGALSVERAAALVDAPMAFALTGGATTVADLAHRLTSLEMRELNERQRADHISRLYEQLRLTLAEFERRNSELERNMEQVLVCLCVCVSLCLCDYVSVSLCLIVCLSLFLYLSISLEPLFGVCCSCFSLALVRTLPAASYMSFDR